MSGGRNFYLLLFYEILPFRNWERHQNVLNNEASVLIGRKENPPFYGKIKYFVSRLCKLGLFTRKY
jgi:hypothetical protein